MSGSTQLKASLLLQLEDKLTAGLGKLQKQLEQLRDLAKTLGLGELEDGLEKLRGGTSSVDEMTNALRGVERQADRTGEAIGRMANSANDNISRASSRALVTLNRSAGALVAIAATSARAGGALALPGVAAASSGGMALLAAPAGMALLAAPAGQGGGAGGGGGGGYGGAAGLPGSGSSSAGGLNPGGIPLGFTPSRTLGIINAGRGVLGATRHFNEVASNGVNRLMGSAAEAFAVYEPIKAYAEYENTLRHIAITEKKSGPAVGVEIKRLTALFAADALETGQSSKSIADAYSDLVQTGIPASVLDVAIKAHSKAATAYNVSPEAMGPAVGALLQNLKIPETELGSALAAMAQASKEGRFKIEDFSRQLPGISGQMALLGMTGRKSADIAFAGLETVMKNSGEPNQAAVDLYDALHYITSPIAKRSFAKEGIDLPKLLSNAQKQGINPLDAVLGKLDSRIQGKGPVEAAEYLGKLLHNQQAGQAILSLLQHKGEFLELRKLLDGVSAASLNTDFITAFSAPTVQLRIFTEQLQQLERILGEGFAPVMMILNIGLLYLLKALTWMNVNMPATLHVILGVIAGLLAFGSVLTIIGVAVPVMAAGFGVLSAAATALGLVLVTLLSPIGLVLAAEALLAGAAYDIYENWDRFGPFFAEVWSGVREVFGAFVGFVRGVFHADLGAAFQSLSDLGPGLGKIFEGMWDIVKGVFNDFLTWADHWSGGLAGKIVEGLISGLTTQLHSLESILPSGSSIENILTFNLLKQLQPPAAGGGAAGLAAAPAAQQVGGRIDVHVAGPGTATATSSNPRVPIVAHAPNTGRVLNRR